MQRYNSSGFTLLELLVAIAIVAILLGIGIPSFADAMRRNRVASVTNDFSGALALARSEAVKRGLRVTVCPANGNNCLGGNDWSGGLLAFHDDTGLVGNVDAGVNGDEIIQRFTSAAEERVALTADRPFLTFRPDGSAVLPAGVDAVITVVPAGCSNDEARTVTVIGAGRAAVTRLVCP